MQEKESNEIKLELVDIVNGTKILEAAIDRKAFTAQELIDIIPIFGRFKEFSDYILSNAEKAEAAASDAIAEDGKDVAEDGKGAASE